MKRASKNAIILLILSVLTVALVVGMVMVCIKMASYVPEEDPVTTEHPEEIIFSDEINLFLGQTTTVSPYFMDVVDGSITTSRFTYESNCEEIVVDAAGNVTANGVPTKDAYVTISDTRSTEKKSVRVYVNDGLSEVLYVETETGERLKKAKDSSIGTQKYVNNFAEKGNEYVLTVATKPSIVEIGEFCTITVEEGKNVFEVTYSGNEIHLKPTGVGSGTLNINVTANIGGADVKLYDKDMSFEIGMSNSTVYNAIMESSKKSLLTKDELSSITTLTVDSSVVNMNSLSMLPSLKTLYIDSNSVVNMANLYDWQEVEYLVPDSVYNQYIYSNTWSKYLENLTPYSQSDSDARYIVYHNILSGDITYDVIGSNLNSLLLLNEQNGKKFVGWCNKGNDTVLTLSDVKRVDGSIHVYSKWREAQYTVVYHVRAFNTIVREVYEINQTFDLKSITTFDNYSAQPGRTFAGWTTYSHSDPSPSDVQYRPNQSVKNLAYTDGAEVHLYDVWDIMTYTISFNTNPEGLPFTIYDSFNSFTVEYGAEYELPTLTVYESGYVFKGWQKKSKDGSLSTKIYEAGKNNVILAQDDGEAVELVAVIEGIPAYLVFKFNGGTLVSAPVDKVIKDGELVEIKYGEEMVLPLLSQAGKTFKGWMIEGNLYEAGDTFVQYHDDPSANKLYYVEAVWE